MIAVLRCLEIDYAVIGARADAFHGGVRSSADADGVIPLAGPPLASLEAEMKQAGFQTDMAGRRWKNCKRC